MPTEYNILEQAQAFNTGIAAAASEVPITGTTKVNTFNHLEILNSDVVKIEIRLDADSSKAYFIEAKTGFVLDVSEGQQFRSVQQFNRDAAAAETVNLILFKAMHKAPKGG